jgi:hypothetical protein
MINPPLKSVYQFNNAPFVLLIRKASGLFFPFTPVRLFVVAPKRQGKEIYHSQSGLNDPDDNGNVELLG